MLSRCFIPLTFAAGRSVLARNLALLGCDIRVLTTDASGLDAILAAEKDREVPFEEGFQIHYCRQRLRYSVPQSCYYYWTNTFGGQTLCTSAKYTTSPRSRAVPLSGA